MRKRLIPILLTITALLALLPFVEPAQGQSPTYIYDFTGSNANACVGRSYSPSCAVGAVGPQGWKAQQASCSAPSPSGNLDRLEILRNWPTTATITSVTIKYSVDTPGVTTLTGFFQAFGAANLGGSQRCTSNFSGTTGLHTQTNAVSCTSSQSIYISYPAGPPSVIVSEIDITVSGPLPETYTPSPTATNTASNTPTNTLTPSNTPTETYTPSNTPTNTLTPSNTPTETYTPTNTLTPSDTPTETYTPSNTPTETFTPTNTLTPSDTPTETYTPTNTLTPSDTPTETLTPSDTPTASDTPTETFTPSNTPMDTDTPAGPTDTPTETFTPSETPVGPTDTPTFTDTPTETPTPTPNFYLVVTLPSGQAGAIVYTITVGKAAIAGELVFIIVVMLAGLFWLLRRL